MLNYLWCVKNLPVQFLAPTRHTCTFQTRLAFCNLQNLQGCIFYQLGTWIGSLLFLWAFLLFRIDKTGRAYLVAKTTHQISSARLQKHKKGWTPKPQSHFSKVEDGWLIWDQLLAKEIKSEIEKTWISEGFFQSNALQTLFQFVGWSHIRHKRKDWDWNRDILENLMVKFPYLLSLPGYQA